MKAVGEEVEELWFEDTQLDMRTLAKFVGFTVLCFYHMRRWATVIQLAQDFNSVSCGEFSPTFFAFIVGAQKEVMNLSGRILKNSARYIQSAKEKFKTEQDQVPRKLLRQLALLGQLSEPEKLYNKRIYYYENLTSRQKKLHSAWKQTEEFYNLTYQLIFSTVPAAIEQLRKNRVVLARFIHQKHVYLHPVKILDEAQSAIMKRNLEDMVKSLIGSYHMAVELLRKRQMTLLATQASHELGNLKWLEGDRKAAGTVWSEGVDG
ncbi:unnamed protein product, partial [Amoebophrya sp. A25]|eukprot:GSA25T00016878001.1